MKVLKIIWAVLQFPKFYIRDKIAEIKEALRPKCPECGGTLVFNGYDEKMKITSLKCIDCGREIIDGRGL